MGLIYRECDESTANGMFVAFTTMEYAAIPCCLGTAKRTKFDIINYTRIINNANYRNSTIFFLSLLTIFPTTMGFAPGWVLVI